MPVENFMEKLRSFFGYHIDPPKNEFRNPIWGSDDDDDGDELYTREHHMDMDSYLDIHQEISRHMQDMMSSFGGIFGDVKTFFHNDLSSLFGAEPPVEFAGAPNTHVEPSGVNSNRIREYYLKPGYNIKRPEGPKDIDLDGKISSQEISGLLKKHEDTGTNTPLHFNGNMVPGRSFCKTIITTSITKPDGSVETRKIIKNGNEVVEETTTLSGPDGHSPFSPGLTNISSTGVLLSELVSLFRNFY